MWYLPDLPKPLRLTADELMIIRGHFRENKSDRFALGILGVCFSVIPLAALTFCIFGPGSHAPSDTDKVTCIVLAAIWIVVWIFLWFAWDNQWEFTGTEIIKRHGRFVHWRVRTESIARAEVEVTPERAAFLHVFTPRRRYSMRVVPELLDLLRQSAKGREQEVGA